MLAEEYYSVLILFWILVCRHGKSWKYGCQAQGVLSVCWYPSIPSLWGSHICVCCLVEYLFIQSSILRIMFVDLVRFTCV